MLGDDDDHVSYSNGLRQEGTGHFCRAQCILIPSFSA